MPLPTSGGHAIDREAEGRASRLRRGPTYA